MHFWLTVVAGAPLTKFVIISAPRSATNELVKALNDNENVTCHFEAFHPNGVYLNGHFAGDWTTEQRDQNRSTFTSMLFELRDPEKPFTKAQGFKVFPSHLKKEELQGLVRQRDVKKIVLRRTDVLAQFVSSELALQAEWWTRPGQTHDGTKLNLVYVKLDRLRDFQNNMDSWYDEAWELSKEDPSSWLFLNTEDLFRNIYAMSKFYSHLEIPLGKTLPYHPYDARGVRDKISNYDEIKLPLGLPNY